MRITTFALVSALAAGPAAADICNGRSTAILSLESWSASEATQQTANVAFTVRNQTKRTLRMVDGYITFRDALGKDFLPIALTRDVDLPPGETVAREVSTKTHIRLARVRPEDVRAAVCVRSVLYEDGTVEEF